MTAPLQKLPKYLFVFLALLITAYALSYYWHSDATPFGARYHVLNPIGVYSHFIGAGLALLFGGLQVLVPIGSITHRLLGYGYCLAVVIGALGGGYLALHAYLGVATGLGFLIADVLWITATLVAIIQVRAGNIRAHRQWMWRSMALTSAGISLRIWLPFLSIFFSLDTSYILVAWLSWLGNIFVIELYFYYSHRALLRHQPVVHPSLINGI